MQTTTKIINNREVHIINGDRKVKLMISPKGKYLLETEEVVTKKEAEKPISSNSIRKTKTGKIMRTSIIPLSRQAVSDIIEGYAALERENEGI
jgi:hypothetical protein